MGDVSEEAAKAIFAAAEDPEADPLRLQADDWRRIRVEWMGARPVLPEPRVGQMAANLGATLVEWGKAGFPVATESQAADRAAVCRGCQDWDAGARMGLGRCRVCGCTRVKWWLASAKCKRGLWAA
jgi:hypothetical protein